MANSTNYEVNFTDQSRSFSLNPYTTNGPENPNSSTPSTRSAATDTTLLLYGKGTPDYGERTAENFVNLLENFSSSNEPVYPISGQLWFHQDGTTSQLKVYDISRHSILVDPESNDVSWFAIGFNNVIDKNNIISRLNGVDTNFRLMIHDAGGNREAYIISTAAAVSAVNPDLIRFKVTPSPPSTRVGWTYGDWANILHNDQQLTADLDVGGWNIVNLQTPDNDQDATTKLYVDTEITDAINDINQLGNMTDVTLTTPVNNNILIYDNGVWVNSTGTDIFLPITGGTITGAVSITSTLTLTGILNLNSNRIINVGYPTIATDAATMQYVLDQSGTPSLSLDDLTDVAVNPSSFEYDLLQWNYPTNDWVNIRPQDFVDRFALVSTGGNTVASNASSFISDHNILTSAGGTNLTAPFTIPIGHIFGATDFVNRDYVDQQTGSGTSDTDGVVDGGSYDDDTIELTLNRTNDGVPMADIVVPLTNIKDVNTSTITHTMPYLNLTTNIADQMWEQLFYNSPSYPDVITNELLNQASNILGIHNSQRQRSIFQTNGLSVVNLGPGSVTNQMNPVITNEPHDYVVGFNTANVYANGVKYIASEPGFRLVSSDSTFSMSHGVDTGITTHLTDVAMVDVNTKVRQITVAGDYTAELVNGATFDIVGSTGNDGTYTVDESTFDSTNTSITIIDNIVHPTIDGDIDTKDYQLLFVDATINQLVIAGDQTSVFSVGTSFNIIGSTGNDGTYSISVSVFNGTNTTIITVEDIVDTTLDGSITLPDSTIISSLIEYDSFNVATNLTATFTTGTTFAVINSTDNNRIYTVFDSSFGADTNILVLETIPSTVVDGSISTTSFSILSTDIGTDEFTVAGDQTASFTNGVTFITTIDNITNTNYTVASSTFDSTNTIITVQENVTVEPINGTIYLPDFSLTNLNVFPREFLIAGDLTSNYPIDSIITVIGSAGNDGFYVINNSVFGGINTTLSVNETIISNVVDGNIEGAEISYTFDVAVNGQASVEVSIGGSSMSNIGNLVSSINALADTNYHQSGTPDTKWAFGAIVHEGSIKFVSSLSGLGSTVDLTDGVSVPLFGSIVGDINTTGLFNIELPLSLGLENDYPPVDYSYNEIGRIGTSSQLIQFNTGTTLPVNGSTIEIVIDPIAVTIF